ncbi:MAG TPA: methyltransferase domain-containing protein [Candidatus Limnocylindrales bacterium]|nr:methyltransferase domain-containing protein [Candidatus Limnocylindrales bacterium]
MNDPWDKGNDYDRFMGRWSRLIAPRFLEWLGVPPGLSWLDVGSGTGALLRAIADNATPTRLAGVDPSERFLAVAAEGLPIPADLRVGDAEHLPFADGDFDAVVSGLVLNFVPDQEAALRAMRAACRPGGVVAAYVWDYAEGMQFLRYFWDVATELDPDAAELDEGKRRFPLCQPEPLAALFTGAGLAEVETTGLDAQRRLEDFDAYWQPFLGGQGPAGGYVLKLSEPRRARLARALQERLPTAADGSITLNVRAWGVRGAA